MEKNGGSMFGNEIIKEGVIMEKVFCDVCGMDITDERKCIIYCREVVLEDKKTKKITKLPTEYHFCKLHFAVVLSSAINNDIINVENLTKNTICVNTGMQEILDSLKG
jgi:predicted nucleic acid-binding Zn ribbon protein